MAQELLYTSAPRGLKPGSRGFCTVLATQGMPAPLASAVEALSGYRAIYPPSDERAARNPVVYSHLKMQATGRSWHVLSRIADYGLDYSQRPNKLAHHVILDNPAEQLPGGPANLLSTSGFMRESWEGDPTLVAPKPITREQRPHTGVCEQWKEVTGDAGWAGVVAESFLNDPDRQVILLFEPGQDILPLIAEAISLLPREKRWDVTFSTYFTGLATGTTCNWRAIVHGSKEATESLRNINALRLDLSNDSVSLTINETHLVSAARSSHLHQTERLLTKESELSSSVFDGPKTTSNQVVNGIPAAPPMPIPPLAPPQRIKSNSKPKSHRAHTNNKLADSPTDHAKFITSFQIKRRLLFTSLSFIVLLLAATSVAIWTIRTSPSKNNQHSETHSVATIASELPTNNLESSGTAAESPAAESPNDAKLESDIDSQPPLPQPPEERASQASATKTQITRQRSPRTEVVDYRQLSNDLRKTPILEFQLNSSPPITADTLYNMIKQGFADKPEFASTYGTELPRLTLLTPLWLKWKLQKDFSSNDRTITEIVDNPPNGTVVHASFSLSKREPSTFSYNIQSRVTTNGTNLLKWCVLQLETVDDASGLPRRISFCNRTSFTPDGNKLQGKAIRIVSDIPTDDRMETPNRISDLWIACGDDSWPIDASEWTPASTGTPIQCTQSLTSQVQKVLDLPESYLESHSPVTLTISFSGEEPNVTVTAKLTGLFHSGGLLEQIKKKLLSELSSELTINLSDFDGHKIELQPLKNLFENEDKGKQAIAALQSQISNFVNTQIPKLRKEDKITQARTDQIDQIETQLSALPSKLAELQKRHKQLITAENIFNTIRLKSLSINYTLFRLNKQHLEKCCTAPLIDFNEREAK
ncbi:GAP1-N2 domain-containing protein [Schlesneria paludicola]|uniref:GAP1-N2 domain-containing protein n=1 Tax=Schlesneria paludicola TaxID=360056 RepID=UPI00029AD9AD|nr:hypothetical protein [Schlesneria paludicola]